MPDNFNGLLPVNRLINNQRPELLSSYILKGCLPANNESKYRQVKLFTGDNIELTIHKIDIIYMSTSMQAYIPCTRVKSAYHTQQLGTSLLFNFPS